MVPDLVTSGEEAADNNPVIALARGQASRLPAFDLAVGLITRDASQMDIRAALRTL
jgi:hypothetical protein